MEAVLRVLSAHALVTALILAACSGARDAAPARDNADAAQPEPASLIGRVWDGDSTPIAGATSQAEWLVQFGSRPDTVFGLSIYSVQGRRLILAAMEIGRSGQFARWRNTDAMWLPPMPDSQVFTYDCFDSTGLALGVFAYVQDADAEWYANVRRAWRLDRVTGRLEETSVNGLRCRNVGYGV